MAHSTSASGAYSRRYAQSNGLIEHQVRYIKPIIQKCLKVNSDIHKALLNVRATPLDYTLPSPAELMFGRPIPTTLPSDTSQMAPENYQEHVKQWSNQQKSYGDQHTRPLPPLLVGKPVPILDKQSKTWFPGTITAQKQDKSYQILTEADTSIIRNRQHLRDQTPPNDAPICTSTIAVDAPNSNGNTIVNSTPICHILPTHNYHGAQNPPCRCRNTKACRRDRRGRWTIPLQTWLGMHDMQTTLIPKHKTRDDEVNKTLCQ